MLAAFLALSCAAALAQDDSGSGSGSSSGSGGAPPAATGPSEPSVENPPLSGLDAPSAEPAFGGRSYLVPGIQLSETVDSNLAGNSTGKRHIGAISRGLGSLDLQKLWRNYQLGVDYIAGGDVYTGPTIGSQPHAYQVHTFSGDQRILWRTGQLSFRDMFDYLPEGSFGFSSYGGAGAFGSALGGVSGTGVATGLGGGTPSGAFNGTSYGSIAFQPRIDNSAIVDIVQELSPRMSVTLAGGYTFSDYLHSSSQFPLVNSQQTTGQFGWNRRLNKKDQIGLAYAFQELHFPQAHSGSVTAHIWNGLYGHRVTGKLNFTVSGGPQYVIIHNPSQLVQILPPPFPPILFPPSETKRISANGSIGLGYTVSQRTSVQLAYQRYVSPGSGFYAGANTDAARASVGHLFGRHWVTNSDFGYSHNSNLAQPKAVSNPGVHSKAYQFWYAGTSIRRNIGRHFDAFAAYQFNDLGAGACTTSSTSVCGQTTKRHTGSIGIDWRPRPIRLD